MLQAFGGVNLSCGWYHIRGQPPSTGGQVHTHTHTHVTHLVCDKGAIGSAPQLRYNSLHNGNAFTGPFFMKRRSPLDPESSRTLIVLFLTYSPELTFGSGVLAQSEHVILLFSIKLVQFRR
jgi:hypothetical protein